MELQSYCDLLEKQIRNLTAEKEIALKALELASSLGNFGADYTRLNAVQPILEELTKRARAMVDLSTAAVYLVDEETNDFEMAFCDSPDHIEFIEDEVDGLIQDQSFAWALDQNKVTFFLTSDKSGYLLLHPMATSSRTRGMFIGVLPLGKRNVSDITLALFTVVMLSCAHALESIEFYQQVDGVRRNLEQKVERRTKELERILQQQTAVFNSLPAGIILVDIETHRIIDVNPVALEMVGLPKEKMVGGRCFETICPAQEGACPITDLGKTMDHSERVLKNQEGREIPILKSVVQVDIHAKKYLLESFVDISEQKKLAQLKEDVERIMRHDLKSPLTGIIGIPDLLLLDSNLTDAQKKLLEMIRESGFKMLNMINFSHDLYKMETGSYKLEPMVVNILPILKSITDELSSLMDAKRMRAEIFLGNAAPGPAAEFNLIGEGLLFYSLFANIVKNAIEASPYNEKITIRLQKNGKRMITVHNQGMIPLEIQPVFFDKYVTHGKKNGTGLGAYSARLISNTLKGELYFRTSAEDGTCLIMEFPDPIDPGLYCA